MTDTDSLKQRKILAAKLVRMSLENIMAHAKWVPPALSVEAEAEAVRGAYFQAMIMLEQPTPGDQPDFPAEVALSLTKSALSVRSLWMQSNFPDQISTATHSAVKTYREIRKKPD